VLHLQLASMNYAQFFSAPWGAPASTAPLRPGGHLHPLHPWLCLCEYSETILC